MSRTISGKLCLVGATLADRIEAVDHALTVKDLGRFLSLSRNPIYEMAADGRLPSMKIGATLRFDPAITAAWLREKNIGVVLQDRRAA